MTRLERHLQVRLFERARTGVGLTAAGAALLDRARPLLADAQQLVDIVREIGGIGRASLRVGVSRMVQNSNLDDLLHTFQADTGMALEVYELATQEQLEGLPEGALDVGVLVLPSQGPRDESIDLQVLLEQPNGVWLSARHRLARRAVIPLQELAQLPYLLVTREANPGYDEAQLEHCRRAGFEPVAIARSRGSLSLSAGGRLIAAGGCWTIQPQVVAGWPGTVWRPCEPAPPPFQLAMAWQRTRHSERVGQLRRFLVAHPLRLNTTR